MKAMTPERWKQIDELAQSALERGDDQRAAFLEEACAGDDVLRHEVESQIAYQQQASKFLEEPAFKHAAELIADRRTETGQVRGGEETSLVMGTQFGPYDPFAAWRGRNGRSLSRPRYKAEARGRYQSLACRFLL